MLLVLSFLQKNFPRCYMHEMPNSDQLERDELPQLPLLLPLLPVLLVEEALAVTLVIVVGALKDVSVSVRVGPFALFQTLNPLAVVTAERLSCFSERQQRVNVCACVPYTPPSPLYL